MSAAVTPPFVTAGATAAPDPRELSVRMDKLFDFVFTASLPGMNERVKTPFRTPFQTLHYLQSLVGVVLGSEEPACSPATEKCWEHLHRCTSAFPAPAARARASARARRPQQSPPPRGGLCRGRSATVPVHVPEATSHRQLWPLPRCARCTDARMPRARACAASFSRQMHRPPQTSWSTSLTVSMPSCRRRISPRAKK